MPKDIQRVREDWLEKRVESWYGKRCPDFVPSCACCHAWFLYDKIVKGNYLKGDFKQSYDKNTDATYVYIGRTKPKRGIVAETLDLSDFVNLDFDKNKNLVGIEILSASKHTPKCLRA